MAYIGRGLDKISNIEVLDAITFTDSAGPYNITQSSTAFVPAASNALVISIDGVVQDPGSYTTSVATITFDSVMAATSTMNFMYQIGVGVITTPSDGSVTEAKIGTDAVTTAKIKDLNVTVGKLPASVDLSTKTITLPATVAGLGTGIDVTSQITGVVPTANLGSGTASASTYLAGDQSYKEIVATDIAWQSVVTAATLTAVAGRGYPINTTSNACTVTLPAAASVGDQIIFTDYARNWNTNAVTINQNSLNYQGNATPNPVYDTDGESIHIVYMDVTKGWVPLYDGAVALETSQFTNVEYLVVGGGGGGGGAYYAGGGGAGGYRTNYDSTVLSLTTATAYTITVGTGPAAVGGGAGNGPVGGNGGDSVLSGTGISTITATGGGGGGAGAGLAGATGGSGGGGVYNGSGVAGNVGGDGGSPSIPEGFAGGDGYTPAPYAGGGGGGASEVGATGTSGVGGDGGDGLANEITGSSVTYAGGGGGGNGSSTSGGNGGAGGGGAGGKNNVANGVTGTDGLGGGGGGCDGYSDNYKYGGAGGDGIVILRMADAKAAAGTAVNEDSTATNVGGSGETVITWLVDGSFTTA